MKKYIPLLCLLLISTVLFAQKIETNVIDSKLNLVERYTQWEKLSRAGEFNSYFRIRESQWDTSYYFELKIILVTPADFAIAQGEDLVLTLANGDKLTLKCFKSATTCIGCGSAGTIAGSQVPGIQVVYKLPKKEMELLRYNPVLTKEQEEKHRKVNVEKIAVTASGKVIENNLTERSYYLIRKAIRSILK